MTYGGLPLVIGATPHRTWRSLPFLQQSTHSRQTLKVNASWPAGGVFEPQKEPVKSMWPQQGRLTGILYSLDAMLARGRKEWHDGGHPRGSTYSRHFFLWDHRKRQTL